MGLSRVQGSGWANFCMLAEASGAGSQADPVPQLLDKRLLSTSSSPSSLVC